jgi:DNA-directed RNA polymerase omega subunit
LSPGGVSERIADALDTCVCRLYKRGVRYDEDHLVLPQLRYGTAAVEDEMPKLSQAGDKLVALDRRRSSSSTCDFLTTQTSIGELKMAAPKKSKRKGASVVELPELWPGIDAQFRLIILAAQRSKQLVRGATARIEPDPLRRRSTSIALEEVKRGLVPFTITKPEQG